MAPSYKLRVCMAFADGLRCSAVWMATNIPNHQLIIHQQHPSTPLSTDHKAGPVQVATRKVDWRPRHLFRSVALGSPCSRAVPPFFAQVSNADDSARLRVLLLQAQRTSVPTLRILGKATSSRPESSPHGSGEWQLRTHLVQQLEISLTHRAQICLPASRDLPTSVICISNSTRPSVLYSARS